MKFIKLIKRWINMLGGKSAFHVKQGEGKFISKMEMKGYYNDLTNKVSEKTILDDKGIPQNTTIAGIVAYFPITIFQYGLGLYDLYLDKKDINLLNEFIKIADWAIEKIEEKGRWQCMGELKDKAHKTQSSMCQGEGVSLLLRAYKETNNIKYYEKAKMAIDYMLKDVNNDGTTVYDKDEVIFQEYVSDYNLSVLNGWIFSVFGLYDFTLINNDEKYKEILDRTLNTMCKCLKKYDRGFWSNYDMKKTIASPAYHDLHIMQLNILYKLFEKEEFKFYSEKWSKYQNKKFNKCIAMMIKLKQKIFKSKYYDIDTTLVR